MTQCANFARRESELPYTSWLCLQVAVLGQIQGYLVAIGLQNWQAVHSCAFRPHTAAGLHRHATLSYRRFAMCLISNALQVEPAAVHVNTPGDVHLHISSTRMAAR